MANKIRIIRYSAIVYFRRFLFGIVLILALWACDRPKVEPHSQKPVTEVATIRLTPANVNLAVGQTQQLVATLGDAAGNIVPRRTASLVSVEGSTKQSVAVIGDSMGRTGQLVTWSSSQPTKVSIDAGGLVTALAVGMANITATSEGRSETAQVIVKEPSNDPVTVVPASANLAVGETLQLTAKLQDNNANVQAGLTTWTSDQPTIAAVTRTGLVQAIAVGTTTITASSRGQAGTTIVNITPSTIIHGLDFPGNAGVNKTMRFEFTSPLAAYPATYIWRVYLRQQQSYYTAFFWGNNGAFYPLNTYYGFHPYPDWNTKHQHFWEIAAPPGGDFVSPRHVVYDRWYTQVAICNRIKGTTTHEFYWDWPDVTKVNRHTGKVVDDPPVPGLIVGDAPWNPGNEAWDGVLRGFQFYDIAMTPSEIAQEIVSPGSVRKPWYINVNPTPFDISDKSGSGHHPAWVGFERPTSWTGTLIDGKIIQTTVAPR